MISDVSCFSLVPLRSHGGGTPVMLIPLLKDSVASTLSFFFLSNPLITSEACEDRLSKFKIADAQRGVKPLLAWLIGLAKITRNATSLPSHA